MTIQFQLTRVVPVLVDSLLLSDAIDREFSPTAGAEPPLSHLLPLAKGLPILAHALRSGDRDRITVSRVEWSGLKVGDAKRGAAYVFGPAPDRP